MSQSCIKLHLPIHRGPSISQFFAISESFHFLVRVIKDQTADHTKSNAGALQIQQYICYVV